nr:hypothetical protein [Tanacetum cinerariifolium]
MTSLVFDEQFSIKFAENGTFGLNGFIRIINQVLFFHKGPILKFYLDIPAVMFLDSFREVDQWMLFLSRNGVQELHLMNNTNQPYQLPCYVFSCPESRAPNLDKCIFKPPLNVLIDKAIQDILQAERIDLTRILSHLPETTMFNGYFLKEPQLKDSDAGPVSNYLESPDCLGQTLNLLKTLEIKKIDESRPELLHFIKLLLAHSPSLIKFTIEPTGTSLCNNIAKDVMQFPRASQKADIIFLDPQP